MFLVKPIGIFVESVTPPLHPTFLASRAFSAVLFSWFSAQFIKVLRSGLRRSKQKGLSMRWVFDTGGMPSAHSATVSCLTTVMGMYYGFDSMIFLMSLIYTIIIMFDAAGVRRNVGRQARILNKMLDELYEKGAFPEQRLKELLGHTPVEVFVGCFLGIGVAYLFCGL